MNNVRLRGLIGSYTILNRNGSFITLADCTGQPITAEQFRIAGGYKQDKVKYEYGTLKTHVNNVIDWL